MFDFLFNPKGRVSRRQIWIGFLIPYMGASALANFLDGSLAVSQIVEGGKPAFGVAIFSLIVGVFFLWPSIAVPVKRLHDRGASGWWLLAFAGAAIGLFGGALWVLFADIITAASSGYASQAALEAHMQSAITRVGASGGASDAMLLFFAGLAVMFTQFVVLYLLPGNEGENRYGPDPKDGASAQPQVSTDRLAATSAWNQVERRMAERRDDAMVSEPETTTVSTMRQGDFLAGSSRPSFGRRGG